MDVEEKLTNCLVVKCLKHFFFFSKTHHKNIIFLKFKNQFLIICLVVCYKLFVKIDPDFYTAIRLLASLKTCFLILAPAQGSGSLQSTGQPAAICRRPGFMIEIRASSKGRILILR